MLTATISKAALHSIGLILVQDRRIDMVIESTIAVLTMALRKEAKQIDSELFSQELA